MGESWVTKPSELLTKENLKYFVPTDEMTYFEKINAVTRFIIYGSVLLYLVRGESLILLIPLISMIIIYCLVKWGLGLKELKEYFGEKEEQINEDCLKPSLNNPFMNVMPGDSRDRAEACSYTQDTKKQIEDAFESNLYEDINDIYGKNNSQRQFYTMPNTDMANKQTEFANWLYNNGPTKKENPSWK